MSECATPNLREFLCRMSLETIDDFRYESPISGGGTNFTALFSCKGKKAVAKFFFMGPNTITMKRFRNEIDNHEKLLKLSNILPEIYKKEFHSTDGFICGYLMEYIDGQSLETIIPSTGFGETNKLFAAFYRVTWAYHKALGGHVVHGDLHPGNIFFETTMDQWLKNKPESPEVRILDLGASISPHSFYFIETFDKDLWADHHKRFAGSFYSLAPEFLTKGYTRSMELPGMIDCWSLGLLLYKMTTGDSLKVADSLGSYAAQINDGSLQSKLATAINQNVKNYHLNMLQKWMLQVNPDDRMSLSTATLYIAQLYQNDTNLINKEGKDLQIYVKNGCDPEFHLPPHERSDSPY